MSRVYSKDSINQISGGDADFTAVLVQTFLEEIPADLQGMKNAFDQRDIVTAYRFAHKMKPNLQMFGIELLQEIRTVEAWTKSKGNDSIIAQSVSKIYNVVSLAIEQLKQDY